MASISTTFTIAVGEGLKIAHIFITMFLIYFCSQLQGSQVAIIELLNYPVITRLQLVLDESLFRIV